MAAIADEARRKAGKEYLLQLAKALIDEIRVWDPMKFGDCNEYMEEIQSIGGWLEPHTDAAALGSMLSSLPFHDIRQRLKPPFRQLDRRVRCKAEPIQIFQFLPDFVRQHSLCRLDEIHADTRTALADIPFRLCQLIFVEIEQQTSVVVEHRRGSLDFHRLIIKQETEIAEVAISF